MAHDEKYLESLELARKLAADNGGFLQPVSWLIDHGFHRIVRAIHQDRRPFESILSKLGRGRDKNKYAYVEAHMDVDDDELAKDLDLSKTTIRNWKAEIREQGFIDPDPKEVPEVVTADELARYIVKNVPDGWRLDLMHDADGCDVSLVQPNGMRKALETASWATVAQSVATHVNYARKKSGLEPAEWGRR